MHTSKWPGSSAQRPKPDLTGSLTAQVKRQHAYLEVEVIDPSTPTATAGRLAATLNALLAVGPLRLSAESERAEALKIRTAHGVKPARKLDSLPMESFDQSYLDALASEGIDLDKFLREWRHSLSDDLQQLAALRARRDFTNVRAFLHRLSGAVGIVGASSLAEALRRASITEPVPEAAVLDTLATRVEILSMQLDEAMRLHRSKWQ